MKTTVVSVRKAELNKRGIAGFKEWDALPNTVYIGRRVQYISWTYHSKWANKYSVKQYGLQECLRLYEEYIRTTPGLMDALTDLRGKEMGCWCEKGKCHGDILMKLLNEHNPVDE